MASRILRHTAPTVQYEAGKMRCPACNLLFTKFANWRKNRESLVDDLQHFQCFISGLRFASIQYVATGPAQTPGRIRYGRC